MQATDIAPADPAAAADGSPADTPSRWVTVDRFTDPAPAQFALSQLLSAGFEARLDDLATASLDWTLTNAIGGVKLQVASPEAPAAAELLAAVRERAMAAAKAEPLRCPACGKKGLVARPFAGRWFFVVWLVWIFAPIALLVPMDFVNGLLDDQARRAFNNAFAVVFVGAFLVSLVVVFRQLHWRRRRYRCVSCRAIVQPYSEAGDDE